MRMLLVTPVVGYYLQNSFNKKMLFCLPSLSLLHSKHKRQIFPLTHRVSPLYLSKIELVVWLLMTQVLSLINVGSLVRVPGEDLTAGEFPHLAQ